MKIYIWDNGGITMDRYAVLIGQHIYYMSIHPDRANEVNMYAGTLKSDINAMNKTMERLKFKNVKMPKSLKYAIKLRCKEIRHETKTEHNTQ